MTAVQRSYLREFLGMLHESGYRNVRALRSGEIRTANFSVTDVEGFNAFVRRYRTWNLYIGVAERTTRTGGNLQGCRMLRLLFVDIDFKDVPEDEARQRLGAFPLLPSVVICTGNGLHVYWILVEPIDLQTRAGPGFARLVLRALAKAVGGDLQSAEPARVLRLPGTLNLKYTPARPVVIDAWHSERRYPQKAFSFLRLEENTFTQDRTPVEHNLSREDRLQLARSWVEGQAPAIEGQGGDALTYQMCCAVTNDFDLGVDDAFSVLRGWNSRCLPPWDDDDLLAKLRSADQGAKGRRGSRLVAGDSVASLLTGVRGICGLRGIR